MIYPHSLLMVSVNGMVFSFGNGRNGRLGLGDEESHSEPQLIEHLKSV